MGGGEGEGSGECFPNNFNIFTDFEKNAIKFPAKVFLRRKPRTHSHTPAKNTLTHTSQAPNLVALLKIDVTGGQRSILVGNRSLVFETNALSAI